MVLDEIVNSFRVLEGGKDIEEYTWIPPHHLSRGATGKWLRLKVKGNRPTKVSISNLVYWPQPYLLPLLRCPVCQKIGHSVNTCRSPPRCSRCSGPHSYKVQDKTCTLPYHCFQCGGPHGPRSVYCPHNQQAQRLYTDQANENIPLQDINRNLRDLQPPKQKHPHTQSAQPRAPPTHTHQARQVHPDVLYSNILTANRFTPLQDINDEPDPPEVVTVNPNPSLPPQHRHTHLQRRQTKPRRTQSNTQPAPTSTHPHQTHYHPQPENSPPTPTPQLNTETHTPSATSTAPPPRPRPQPPPNRDTQPSTSSQDSPPDPSSPPNIDSIISKLFSALWDSYRLYKEGNTIPEIIAKVWPIISEFLTILLK